MERLNLLTQEKSKLKETVEQRGHKTGVAIGCTGRARRIWDKRVGGGSAKTKDI